MLNLEKYAKPILRIGMSLVFLYFGISQLISPGQWVGFVPNYALVFGIATEQIVLMNALLEISFGTLLIIGLYTKVASIILALHLVGITFSLGINDLGVRDFGLTVATFVTFINGPDQFCLDNKFKKR
ncbi:MAG: DoxX family membrane protein [Candidatus Pacearchaeota archaeon]